MLPGGPLFMTCKFSRSSSACPFVPAARRWLRVSGVVTSHREPIQHRHMHSGHRPYIAGRAVRTGVFGLNRLCAPLCSLSTPSHACPAPPAAPIACCRPSASSSSLTRAGCGGHLLELLSCPVPPLPSSSRLPLMALSGPVAVQALSREPAWLTTRLGSTQPQRRRTRCRHPQNPGLPMATYPRPRLTQQSTSSMAFKAVAICPMSSLPQSISPLRIPGRRTRPVTMTSKQPTWKILRALVTKTLPMMATLASTTPLRPTRATWTIRQTTPQTTRGRRQSARSEQSSRMSI